MFEATSANENHNQLNDWGLRGGVALIYIIFGLDKFPSHHGASWVQFFDQVGFGQWFRYFTGIVEVIGAILVLVPKTARYGLALLAGTMAGAALIVTFRLGRPGDSVFSGLFCLILSALWFARGKRDAA